MRSDEEVRTNAWKARLKAALDSPEPVEQLGDLACALKAEGVGQVALYRLFSEQFVALDGDDPRCDAVADVMDRIWSGGWGGPRDLFDVGLTTEMLRADDPAASQPARSSRPADA